MSNEKKPVIVDDMAIKLKREVPNWVITLSSVVLVLLLWEYFGRNVNPIFGSHPVAIGIAFWKMVKSGLLLKALAQSLQAFIVGYGLSVIVGIPLGLLIGRSRVLEASIGVFVTAAYAMPLVALVPLLVLWFGLGFTVKAAVVFLMAVFPIVINTWLGVRGVPKTLIEVGKSLVAPPHVVMMRIVLPATLPYIMAGTKLAVGRAVVAMVIAEFFTAISGLGSIIINAANSFDTAAMFVPVIVIMILATGLNSFVGWIERRVAPWHTEMSGRSES